MYAIKYKKGMCEDVLDIFAHTYYAWMYYTPEKPAMSRDKPKQFSDFGHISYTFSYLNDEKLLSK